MARDSGNIILWNVMLESKLQHTVGLSKKMVPSLEDGNLLTDKNQQLHWRKTQYGPQTTSQKSWNVKNVCLVWAQTYNFTCTRLCWAITVVIIFFDRYAKTWQGEHCMQCHIKVLLLYIFPTYIWSMTKLKYDVTVEGSNLLPLALYWTSSVDMKTTLNRQSCLKLVSFSQ